MDICGNVLVSKDVLHFALKCLHCETDIEQWEAFINHIQSFHYTGYEEPCIDPLVELDCKENIVVETIKEEMPVPTALEENEDAMNIEIQVKEEFFKPEPMEEEPFKEQSQNNDIDDGNALSSYENDKKDRMQSKKFNPTFYRHNPNTSVFIELYKRAPCLWDPNDEDYHKITTRANCQREIIEEMKKRCKVSLSNQSLRNCFRKLFMQYQTTALAKKKTPKSKSRKLPAVVLEYFEKCSFLSVAKNDFLDVAEETTNIKGLSFAKLNPTTVAFIETYARFPVLYDAKHEDYSNVGVRKETYKEMSNILKNEHNVEFTDDEVYKGIDYLRHWHFKLKSRLEKDLDIKNLSSATQVYVEKCSFLPARGSKERFKCSECDKVLYTEATRKAHLYKEHNIGDWPYKCNECERSFEYNATLLMHKQRTHMEKGIHCKFCDRTFSVQVDLQRHLDTHTGQKPYVCELCGKGLRSKTQLGYHFDAIHTKIRAFKCTMCPKDFLKASDLKDHIKAHLNIRDKICETCGKGFTNTHALIRHRQLHAPVKKYACKLCDARFYQFVGLNSHMKHRHSIVKRQQKTAIL